MNNTFLLKDKCGCVSGYLMQYGSEIRYRFSCSKEENKEMILLLDNDLFEMKLLSDTGEIVGHDLNAKVEGALVISSENIILLSTGKDACKRWQERQEKKYSKKSGIRNTETQERKIEVEAHQAEECSNNGSERRRSEKKEWPERRWPSPPCMQESKYRDGRWRSQE